jgi:hypothetical protein
MDFMDDFIFGPMNLIARFVSLVVSVSRTSRSRRSHADSAQDTIRLAVPRLDKGGNVPVLDVIGHLEKYGVDVIGGRHAVTHDSQFFYIVVPVRQLLWVRWLYCDGRLRSPSSGWGDREAAKSTGTGKKSQGILSNIIKWL